MNAQGSSRVNSKNHSSAVMRQAGLVLLFVALGLIVGGIVSGVRKTSYRAEATLVAGPADGFLSVQTGSSVEPFTQTARSLLESDAVASRAAGAVGGLSPQTIKDHLSVTSWPQSSALDVKYDDASQTRAVSVLGATIDAFTALVGTRLTAAQGAPAMRVAEFERAHPTGKVGVGWARSLALGAAAGFLLGLALAYLRELRRYDAYGYEDDVAGRIRAYDGAAAAPEPVRARQRP
jgi:uncharacterized protein involved in exopolysaccharide biosynthesis